MADTRRRLWAFLDSLTKINEEGYMAESGFLRNMTLENGVLFLRSALGGVNGLGIDAEELAARFVGRYGVVCRDSERERLLKWFRLLIYKTV